MRKKLWIVFMLTSILILIFELCFIYWAKSEFNKLTQSITSYEKSTTGIKVIPKDFSLTKDVPETTDKNEKKTITIPEIIPFFPTYNESIKEKIDGWLVVKEPHSLLVMVNKQRRLPDNFTPIQLIEPDVRFSFDGSHEKRQMRAIAALALEKLFLEAEKNGHLLYAVSGYRSHMRQVEVFNRHVNELGEEQAKEVSAFPGSSEHQTGLSMDISSESANFELSQEFGNTLEGKWVKENAHLFGFIIRYPEGKKDITGYVYEPWHLRYVGKEYASYLYQNNLTLEDVIK